jgi:hypothetical protein
MQCGANIARARADRHFLIGNASRFCTARFAHVRAHVQMLTLKAWHALRTHIGQSREPTRGRNEADRALAASV